MNETTAWAMKQLIDLSATTFSGKLIIDFHNGYVTKLLVENAQEDTADGGDCAQDIKPPRERRHLKFKNIITGVGDF